MGSLVDAPLLTLDQNVPLVATLDNPCTAAREAIAFRGAVRLTEEVWLLANGNLRLILSELTSIQGRNALLLGGPRYAATGSSQSDTEFLSGAVSILNHKKVITEGVDDNFHTVLMMVFDPSTLKVNLRLAGACGNGEP